VIYFASDFHLGAPDWNAFSSRDREKRVLAWLNFVAKDKNLKAIYLVGDIFDFWFEYKMVVPKGYVRFLGKLAELSDRGIELHIFTGNHDVWMFDYFEKELNAKVHRDPIITTLGDKKIMVGHGDGLGPGDRGYKFIKKIFRNRFCQWLFRWLHPDIGARLATFFSSTSRNAQESEQPFLGKDKEWLLLYSNKKLKEHPDIDLFIFGHRHLVLNFVLDNDKSRYINCGEWFKEGHYVVFDGEEFHLRKFEIPARD
jgi:UDP-2,3-diacylglucosamine hydrolase